MEKQYFDDLTFEHLDASATPLSMGLYEGCLFRACHFSKSQLSGLSFIDCVFDNCDLSMATVDGTTFQAVTFRQCKLIGINFYTCKPFLLSFRFEQCLLDFASFYQLSIKNTVFQSCRLHQTEFEETDASGVVFEHCDLSGTVFMHTILEGADLRTAQHFSINLGHNKLKKARFSAQNLSGLLDSYQLRIE